MNIKNLLFTIGGLTTGLLISLSLKKLYSKLTNIEFDNIIDYE